MNNGKKQVTIEEIRLLIIKQEVSNRKVEKELHKLNRRINNNKVNTKIITKVRVMHQGEGLCTLREPR